MSGRMIRKPKILIAYDGSECADAALDDLSRAGMPAKADALLVSVVESWLPPPPPSGYEIFEAVEANLSPHELTAKRESGILSQARQLAVNASNRICSMFPGWKVRTEAYYGSPASELLAKADEWKPNLIVVGSHGRSAIGRFVLGSVSHKVVTEARCSVRIARGHDRKPASSLRLIIGVDGSACAEAAVREVAKRKWPADVEVRLVTVYDTVDPTLMGAFVPAVVDWTVEENKKAFERASQMASALAKPLTKKMSASSVAKQGNPKRVLIEEAESWKADCIFVGASGLSRVDRFLLGSVSAAVAARAHCSVEVVRDTE
jgi:nucleotide-binding universal stress UspA family protein